MNNVVRFLCGCLLLLGLTCQAQQRPVSAIVGVEAGYATLYDNYLSPLKYDGLRLAANGKWFKALPWEQNRWRMLFDASLAFVTSTNPRGNANMYDYALEFDWGVECRWGLPVGGKSLQLTAGAGTGISAGCLYAPRNGNNPADARLDWHLQLTASASYPFRIGRCHFLLTDAVSLPSFSLFYKQQYGEPYYEIYLGNRSGLVHAGWWGNHFCIDNLLRADIALGKRTLSVGYRFKVESSWQNSLNTRLVSHSLVVGLLFGSSPTRKTASETINAIYQ